MIILKEGNRVYYIGEYERCHKAVYIVKKVFTLMGVWYDLELEHEWVLPLPGPYQTILSVKATDVLGVLKKAS